MITVIIAEDHHLVREAIQLLLEQHQDIKVVAAVANGREAIQAVTKLEPDVLVLDITMPQMNGILTTEEIRASGLSTEVVILSIHARKSLVRQALKAGARGYVVKRSMSDELLNAIRTAHKGETYLNDMVATIDKTDLEVPADFERLTLRERQVLQLIAEGHNNKEMAESLALHIKTIEKHRASLIEKLGVRDIASLVQIALKHGLISLDE